MKRIIGVLLIAIGALVVAVVVNTARLAGGAPKAVVAPVTVSVDSAGAIARLASAVKLQTVSYEEGTRAPDSAAFRGLHELLRVSFPLVHARLARETVAGLSLLYTWRGTDSTLAPVVLMGHLDVVPVVPGTESQWTEPPFGGVVADGFIWGRGTLDDKVSVLAILEAAEGALRSGFQPRRTIYFAFGHDEEVGGSGARALKATLLARGMAPPALVLDEGGAIMPGELVGATGTVALVGTSEKGYLSLQLTATGEGGHSSSPPPHTAVGRLARAITRLEASPFPLVLDGPTEAMLAQVRTTMPYAQRAVLSNPWLFKPLILRSLSQTPASAAMLRTTTAATIVSGGVKANVLPIEAKATVNFRIRPGETVASVSNRARAIIGDSGIMIEAVGFRTDPSPVSDAAGSGFRAIEQSLREVVPDSGLLVTPYLVIGGTDARNWSTVSTQTFRFLAAPMEANALARVHGTNERVRTGAYLTAVRFFDRLVRNTDRL